MGNGIGIHAFRPLSLKNDSSRRWKFLDEAEFDADGNISSESYREEDTMHLIVIFVSFYPVAKVTRNIFSRNVERSIVSF